MSCFHQARDGCLCFLDFTFFDDFYIDLVDVIFSHQTIHGREHWDNNNVVLVAKSVRTFDGQYTNHLKTDFVDFDHLSDWVSILKQLSDDSGSKRNNAAALAILLVSEEATDIWNQRAHLSN